MTLTTHCGSCGDPFLPEPSQDENGVPEDRRPVQSRVCSHTFHCVGCFNRLIATDTRALHPCPLCRKKRAFHRDDIVVNEALCELLRMGWNGTTLRAAGAASRNPVSSQSSPATARATRNGPATANEAVLPNRRRLRLAPSRYENEFINVQHGPPTQRRRTSTPSAQSSQTSQASPGPARPSTSGNIPHSRSSQKINDTSETPTGENPLAAVEPADVSSLGNPPLFTKDLFMSKQIFHINPFINSKIQENEGFGPFIAAKAVTIGFANVTPHYLKLRANGFSKEEATKELKRSPYKLAMSTSDVSQVVRYHTQVEVGDFVLMRHEYPNCEYVPKRLKDDNENYLGPVYVLGVVIDTPAQTYDDIMTSIARSIPRWDKKTQKQKIAFCRVNFVRMGLKRDLDQVTQDYIDKVCQPTFANICQHGKVWKPSGKDAPGTDTVRVRTDLWNKATVPITADEFDDVN